MCNVFRSELNYIQRYVALSGNVYGLVLWIRHLSDQLKEDAVNHAPRRHALSDLTCFLFTWFPEIPMNTRAMDGYPCVSPRGAVILSVVAFMFSYMIVTVNTTHQRWWLYGCQCSNWESRNSVREVVMNSYRGLFVGKDDLNSLPVVKLHRNPGESSVQSYVANTLPNINQFINPGCCYTDYRYEIFNTTTVNTQEFKVVHFDKAFQFVPTGRCRPNSTCSRGDCLQMYRHHWMLVWDERLSTWPPVTFLPVEVPSHCQCVNVGRAAKRRRRSLRSCASDVYIHMKEDQNDIPEG